MSESFTLFAGEDLKTVNIDETHSKTDDKDRVTHRHT